MTQTSEYCALGHPDRTCDFIASYLLDRHLEKDPRSRVALEVQLKGKFCTISGEITTRTQFTEEEIANFARRAVNMVGYTKAYQSRFGAENCICGDELEVVSHISRQSGDIAIGVDADGWGDQGIFWGMATGGDDTRNMPLDHYLAKMLGRELYEASLHNKLPVGLDIKTQISVTDGKADKVIVAVPTPPSASDLALRPIEEWVRSWLARHGCGDASLIVNGTGRYVTHGSIADCGTTGRKLAVDFYGGNCRIGGGCPWGKCPSKADVTLNIYAREIALKKLRQHNAGTVYCAISCCIGRRDIDIICLDERHEEIERASESRPAHEIIADLGLRAPVWAFKCANGLFSMPTAETPDTTEK